LNHKIPTLTEEYTDVAHKRVLVVEDDLDIRESLEQILEIEGYEPLLAENGQAAVEMLKQGERPCLILLDLMMPVMSGWEFLRVQRENTLIATIPVIVVSAAGDRAKSTSANGFIKKPIELENLLEVVHQFCGK
jgi:CheY-like chemotaxis protein